MDGRRILFLPRIPLAVDIVSERARDTLESLGQVVWNEMERDYTADEMTDLLPGVDAVVSSWGSPVFTPELLALERTSENRRPRRGQYQAFDAEGRIRSRHRCAQCCRRHRRFGCRVYPMGDVEHAARSFSSRSSH